jgi:hypothetical protein
LARWWRRRQSTDSAVVEALGEAGKRAGQFGIDGRDLLDQARNPFAVQQSERVPEFALQRGR